VIRWDNAVTLARLREMADVVDLLRSGSHQGPETGEPHGIRWELWSQALDGRSKTITSSKLGKTLPVRWRRAEIQ
jgi:hypothetical protein